MIYLIPVILGAVMSETYFMWQESLNRYWNYGYMGSFGDCLMYIFRGIREFNPQIEKVFEVPIVYLAINIIIALFIGNHAVKDLKGFGLKKLIRYESRLRWWLDACIWNVLCVIKYYAAFYVGTAAMCLVHSDRMDAMSPVLIHEDIIDRMFCGEAEGVIEAYTLFCMIIVLPVLTTMAMSMFQMAMEFFVIPAVSFICVMSVYVLSVFYMTWFMPGNYMMVYRMNQINPDGVGFATGIMLDTAIMIGAACIGYVKFRKYDVI